MNLTDALMIYYPKYSPLLYSVAYQYLPVLRCM